MPDITFTAFTAYKLLFKDVPADYTEVYCYASEKELEIIKKRLGKFKTNERNPNLFVLKKDTQLDMYKRIPVSQVYVDLWNLRQWYAKDFLDAIEEKIL
jgi:hypothetical protein